MLLPLWVTMETQQLHHFFILGPSCFRHPFFCSVSVTYPLGCLTLRLCTTGRLESLKIKEEAFDVFNPVTFLTLLKIPCPKYPKRLTFLTLLKIPKNLFYTCIQKRPKTLRLVQCLLRQKLKRPNSTKVKKRSKTIKKH